jgi:general secretion pathway protein D
MKPKFYQLKNGAKASDVVNKLRTILTGTLQNQLGSATTYSADDRTNQIIVVTDPRQWDFFSELIDKLDQKSDPNTRTEVLYLKHAKAEEVVTVLSRIIQGQTQAIQKAGATPGARPSQPNLPNQPPAVPGQPPQPQIVSANAAGNSGLDGLLGANEFSALMTVVNDNRANAVVVFGTSDDIRLVRDLVDKLDIALAQVRIEVVIAEVTLDDNDASGISALGLQLDGDKLIGFSGSIAGPNGAGAAIADGTITRPGLSGHMDLAATISISSGLRKRNNSITTVPAVVTSHGKKAVFFNGETRPIVTGTLQSAAGVTSGLSSSSTIAQQEIGTRLTVTPFIGVDGSVQLELVQEVTDVIGEVQVDNNKQYIVGKRNAESYVTAKDGEIIVLGGFRKNSTINEKSRLGPIPILGDIFGPRTRGNNRQELIFFLRPTVLTNDAAVDNAEMFKRIEQWTTRDKIKQEIDPNFRPPEPSVLDRILHK